MRKCCPMSLFVDVLTRLREQTTVSNMVFPGGGSKLWFGDPPIIPNGLMMDMLSWSVR